MWACEDGHPHSIPVQKYCEDGHPHRPTYCEDRRPHRTAMLKLCEDGHPHKPTIATRVRRPRRGREWHKRTVPEKCFFLRSLFPPPPRSWSNPRGGLRADLVRSPDGQFQCRLRIITCEGLHFVYYHTLVHSLSTASSSTPNPDWFLEKQVYPFGEEQAGIKR